MSSDDVNASQPPFVSIVVVTLRFAKPFSNVSKIEVFANESFKNWQECVHSLLDTYCSYGCLDIRVMTICQQGMSSFYFTNAF